MSLFDVIHKAEARVLKGKDSSGYSKEDMGTPSLLYSYIKEKADEELDKDGKHQYIKSFDGKLKVYITVYNTPIYFTTEKTGEEVMVKKFEDGKELDWEVRPVLKVQEFLSVDSVEEGINALRTIFKDEYEDLDQENKDFWTIRAQGLNKILMNEQPMIEAYARFLWARDPKALELGSEWIVNVRDAKLTDEQKKKVAPIKSRLKAKAIKQLGFDKDILRERA